VFEHPETVLANAEGGVGIAISDCALSASQAWKALETIQAVERPGGRQTERIQVRQDFSLQFEFPDSRIVRL
jgi:hypothetical protein